MSAAIVIRGDAAHLPLPDACVDLIVCSPPYFGLRAYTDGGEVYDGQIGSEATPREYVAALLACTREWVRVLKPEGSLFVNLGDKYAGAPSGPRTPMPDGYDRDSWRDTFQSRKRINHGVREKSLMGLPWRYALACTDDLGLILRAEIVWAKPNGLPESVTDRVRRSHEQVFHFTRQPRYYSAVDEVREEHTGTAHARRKDGRMSPKEVATVDAGHRRGFFPETTENPLGKLPGSVWEIPSAPLTVPAHLGVDHFAAYPPALVRRIVLGWSPAAVCTACGEGRRPVVERGERLRAWRERNKYAPVRSDTFGIQSISGQEWNRHKAEHPDTLTGYACACPQPDAPARPGVVLDPFGGTGTTALVAAVHGRTGISVDMSADYCRLAQWRVSDPAERARALDVPKPPPVPDGQGDLFEALGLAP